MTSQVQIVPLGGCGEVGMNMTFLSVYGRSFLIDCGTTFPDAQQLGVKIIYPSVRALEEKKVQLEAWLITHGHEDHIGGIVHFYKKFPAPIYTTPFTAKLIEYKFADAGVTGYELHVWKYFQPTIFSNMQVTPFPVNHSIADASGLLIETALHSIVHTGDFRIDQNPPEKITTVDSLKRVVGEKKISLLLSDSTNSFAPDVDRGEEDTFLGMEKYFQDAPGALIVSVFSSHIWRVNTLVKLCKKYNRKLFFFGKSLERNVGFSTELNITHVPQDLFHKFEDAKSFPRNEVCIVCTGTQGEPFSGLHRLAHGTIHNFQVDSQDTVIVSARVIPGNERSIDIVETLFIKTGLRFINSKSDRSIHVSGHGYSEDLKTCMSIVKPKYFMPVHGTYKLLRQHISLAVDAGIPIENCVLAENGDVVTLDGEGISIPDSFAHGRDYLISGGVVSSQSKVYKDRVNLGLGGCLCVYFPIRKGTFELLGNPCATVLGLDIDAKKYEGIAKKGFDNIYSSQSGRPHFGTEQFRNEIRLHLRGLLEKTFGYKTTVIVHFQFL